RAWSRPPAGPRDGEQPAPLLHPRLALPAARAFGGLARAPDDEGGHGTRKGRDHPPLRRARPRRGAHVAPAPARGPTVGAVLRCADGGDFVGEPLLTESLEIYLRRRHV